MGTLLIGVFVVAFIITICLWVQGIDYMKKNHPDYKGEDLIEDTTSELKDDVLESFYTQMDEEVHQNNSNLNK